VTSRASDMYNCEPKEVWLQWIKWYGHLKRVQHAKIGTCIHVMLQTYIHPNLSYYRTWLLSGCILNGHLYKGNAWHSAVMQDSSQAVITGSRRLWQQCKSLLQCLHVSKTFHTVQISDEQPLASQTYVHGLEKFSHGHNSCSPSRTDNVLSDFVNFACIVKFCKQCLSCDGLHAHCTGNILYWKLPNTWGVRKTWSGKLQHSLTPSLPSMF
jgi:hypothetical protein